LALIRKKFKDSAFNKAPIMTMMILFASTKNMIVSSCTAKHHIKFIYFLQLKIRNSLGLLIYLRYSLTIHAFAFFLKLILLQYIEGEKMTIQILADSACDLHNHWQINMVSRLFRLLYILIKQIIKTDKQSIQRRFTMRCDL